MSPGVNTLTRKAYEQADEYKALHPMGKSPVLEDGNKVIAESGAEVEYLIDTYGNGRFKPKAGSDDYWKYIEWIHYAEGSAMLPLMPRRIFFPFNMWAMMIAGPAPVH